MTHFISTGWPKNKDLAPVTCNKYLSFLDELKVKENKLKRSLVENHSWETQTSPHRHYNFVTRDIWKLQDIFDKLANAVLAGNVEKRNFDGKKLYTFFKNTEDLSDGAIESKGDPKIP